MQPQQIILDDNDDPISEQEEQNPDSLEQVNSKVKDMVEAFRKQLHDRDETIDKEKAALNQFISGLV